MSGWLGWHEAYDEPGSALHTRLGLVIGHLARAVSDRPAGPVRLISMCAGQARDVEGALRDHPRRAEVTGRLVELDPRNVAVARERLAGLPGLTVVQGDAGEAGAYAGAVPAGVVLACGIFGNVPDGDIRATIAALPGFCAAGARVIWTRHRRAPDATGLIRDRFAGAGFREIAFDAPAGLPIGVGVHELAVAPAPFPEGRHLFTFGAPPP
ncbi:SAM-dependent methyltransferase [Dactylosporangium sp. CA-233914]|uniref:SAM-dependent methyltransferase n=1 Tax=Dactylosporangium sp. CA-233914 TaxID=3239934 RepID=UPI003D8DD82A